MRERKPPVVAKRSYTDGRVGLAVSLRCGGWSGGTARIEATDSITTAEARALAADLISFADREDAKMAAKAASEQRRAAWREREIAAGRMVVLGRL